MSPKFICNDVSSNSAFTCSQAVACSKKYRNSFTIDTKGISNSIVIENQLYCEKQSIWANSQTLNMTVILIMTIIYLFKKVQLNEKYKYILLSQSIFVIAAILSVIVSNLTLLLILIAIIFMSNQSFYLQMYPFINAHINQKLQTVGVSLSNAFYAISFSLYSLLDLFVQDWRKMMLIFFAATVFLNVIYIIYVYGHYINVSPQNNQQIEETSVKKSQCIIKISESQLSLKKNKSNNYPLLTIEIPDPQENLLLNYNQIARIKNKDLTLNEKKNSIIEEKDLSPMDIIKDKYLLQVTIIYIIVVLSTGAAFIGSQFCLNMLPVDVYNISIVLGIAEAAASLYSTKITAKFPIKTIIQYTSILIAITLIPFYFQDINNTSGSSSFSSYLFFILYVIAKTAMFICWSFAFILLFQCTTSASQGSIICITQLVQMTVLSIIPQYNQMLIKNGINPVASYAIFSIVASFAVKRLKVKKNIEEEVKGKSQRSMKKNQLLQQIASASTTLDSAGYQSENISAFSQSPIYPLFQNKRKMSIEMTPLTAQSHQILKVVKS